jgi:hypothetical protein
MDALQETIAEIIKPIEETRTRKNSPEGYKFTTKHYKLIELMLTGKYTNQEALVEAGFVFNNQKVIRKVQPEVDKLLEEKRKQIEKSVMSKDECVEVLKKIALDSSRPNNQIRAIETLAKICGYNAAISVESKNLNVTVLRMEQDEVPIPVIAEQK